MKINEEVTQKERRILDLTLKLKKANEEISRLKKINSRADDTLKYKDSQME